MNQLTKLERNARRLTQPYHDVRGPRKAAHRAVRRVARVVVEHGLAEYEEGGNAPHCAACDGPCTGLGPFLVSEAA